MKPCHDINRRTFDLDDSKPEYQPRSFGALHRPAQQGLTLCCPCFLREGSKSASQFSYIVCNVVLARAHTFRFM